MSSRLRSADRRLITWIGPRLVAGILALLLGVLGLAACSGPTTNPSDPATVTLTVGATAQPPSLDATEQDAAAVAQVMLYNVYQTLVRIDGDGKMEPLLAQRWTTSPDRTTYTFILDPKAKFASGRQVTAEDVVWNLDRIKNDPAVTPTNKAKQAVVKTARARGDGTVVITLRKPSNSWLYDMTSTAGMIYDAKATVDFATATAGSGPYTLDRWTKGSDLVLKRNNAYWGNKSSFAAVTFRYFADPNAMNAAMLSGGIDVISNLQAPQALGQFADPTRFTVINGTTNGEVVMSLNNTAPALKDLRVRQAINYAIDRQALVKTVWAGQGQLIGSMVPPTDPWYVDLSHTYSYNPAKAKQLLAAAGYANGLKLRMRLPTLPYATSSGQFVQSQLKQVGIDATIDELEFPARWVSEVLQKGDYDISIVAHVEPRDLDLFANPKYYFHYDNAKFRQLVAAADVGTEQQQIDDLRQASRLLADDAAADWLFLLPNLVITTVQVTGVPRNATTLSFDLTTITKTA
ncbi:MAG: ABC transporter substrate-binding protein [Propionibacteriaceae bacterium]